MEEKQSGLGTGTSGFETKEKACCCCTAVLGALVIVFAWWPVSWGSIALTVLGAAIILKELIKNCCCKGGVCKTK